MQRSCPHKLSSHARRASLWYCLNNHCTQLLFHTCIYHVWKIIIITPIERTVSVKKGWAQLQRHVWSWKGGTLNCNSFLYLNSEVHYTSLRAWQRRGDLDVWKLEQPYYSCLGIHWCIVSWRSPFAPSVLTINHGFSFTFFLFVSSQFRSTTAPTRDNSSLCRVSFTAPLKIVLSYVTSRSAKAWFCAHHWTMGWDHKNFLFRSDSAIFGRMLPFFFFFFLVRRPKEVNES